MKQLLNIKIIVLLTAQFTEIVHSELILSAAQPLRVFVREQELEQRAR